MLPPVLVATMPNSYNDLLNITFTVQECDATKVYKRYYRWVPKKYCINYK